MTGSQSGVVEEQGENNISVLSERQGVLDFMGHVKMYVLYSNYDGKLVEGFEWNMAQSDVYLTRII